MCVPAFSGNHEAPYVGLWFILFGIHCLLGCLCFHTYYTLCLCLVYSIFSLQYQFIQHTLFPVSCCSLRTGPTRNKHIRYDRGPLYMQYGYRAYDHVLNSTSVHISLLYWVLSDSLISVIVYYCVDIVKFYIQSREAHLMNL